MKKKCPLWMLIFCLAAFLQVIKAQDPHPEATTDSTGFGTPDGKLVDKVIGAAGGTIVSDDGRVTLIFPVGALANETRISIQPTTNPLTSDTGKAYDFQPSGLQFNKPVQIVFRYTKEEVKTCPADLMNIAQQDHAGKWTYLKYENWDSMATTLAGHISHFSSYANSNGARITPDKRTVIVGGTVNIFFYDRYGTVQSGPFVGNSERQAIGSRYFAVNSIIGGNAEVGVAGPPAQSTTMGTYEAPRIMPRQNPVAIHFFFEYYSEILQKVMQGVVSCTMLVYDEYKLEIKHQSSGRASMNSVIKDKGSFVVRVSPVFPFTISEIQNYEPEVVREGRKGPFKEKVYTEGFQGTIDLTSAHTTDSLSSDYPPEVYFEFTSQVYQVCGIRHSSRGIVGEMERIRDKSIPEEINFIANGQPQRYNVTLGRGETYQLIVTPHGR